MISLYTQDFFGNFLYILDCFSEYTRKKMTPFRIAVEKGIKCAVFCDQN